MIGNFFKNIGLHITGGANFKVDIVFPQVL